MRNKNKVRKEAQVTIHPLSIAMLSIHSSPIGDLGTKDTGGMSVYIRELAFELGSRGHRIDIFTRAINAENQPVIPLHKNVRLIHLDISNACHLSKHTLYRYLPHFFQALEDFRISERIRYDLIHSHYWLSGCIGEQAKQRWDIPNIVTFHTLGVLKNIYGLGHREPKLRIAAEKKLANQCSCIIVAADREKDNIMRYCDVPQHKISVIPCGVNLDIFQPLDKMIARRRLGFIQDDNIVLYVGRFDPLKGLERLFKAITRLRYHQNVKLVIIGGDSEREPASEKLRQMAVKLGIQEAVIFAGRVDHKNLPPYYSAADVVVMPSYYESFGLVALEALACGTPVIATPVGAMENILSDSRCGEVIMNPSPANLAKSINSFITIAQTAADLSDTIRKAVLRFGWSDVASSIILEYNAVIAEHSKAHPCAHHPGNARTHSFIRANHLPFA